MPVWCKYSRQIDFYNVRLSYCADQTDDKYCYLCITSNLNLTYNSILKSDAKWVEHVRFRPLCRLTWEVAQCIVYAVLKKREGSSEGLTVQHGVGWRGGPGGPSIPLRVLVVPQRQVMPAAHLKGNVTLQHRTPLHAALHQHGKRRDVLYARQERGPPRAAPQLLDANVTVSQPPLAVHERALRDADLPPRPQPVRVCQVIQTRVKEAFDSPDSVSDRHVVTVAVGLRPLGLLG